MKLNIIYIEGLIGAGKTSLLNKLQENLHSKNGKKFIFIAEPIEFWRNINDFNPLDTYYKYPMTYKNEFQSYVLITLYLNFIEHFLQALTKDVNTDNHTRIDEYVIFMERSWYSSVYIFGGDLAKQNLYYKALFDFINQHFKQNFKIVNEHFVYLNIKPEIALRNIQKRNRVEEQTIEKPYLELLQTRHNTWLNSVNNCIVINIQDDYTIDDIYKEVYRELHFC